MHPNPIYRATDTITALSFASNRGFGTLAVNGETSPILGHVPFVIDGNAAKLHLVRSNPIARAAKTPIKAKIAILGPDSYVSPDWYGIEDQVPTWNYVAVHLIGTLRPLPDNQLRDILDDLSEEFETRLLPKPIWRSGKMTPAVLAKLMRMIQPFQLDIDDVQSTYKLNQNKSDAVRLSAARHIAQHGLGSQVADLARMQAQAEKETP